MEWFVAGSETTRALAVWSGQASSFLRLCVVYKLAVWKRLNEFNTVLAFVHGQLHDLLGRSIDLSLPQYAAFGKACCRHSCRGNRPTLVARWL